MKPHIALCMMVKNEHLRISVSLESVVGVIQSLVIYDTGSTDNTVEIIEEFAKKHSLPLHLIRGEFIDFSTSRNVLLDYAETFEEIDYLLLLDCNDELRGGKQLLERAEKELNIANHSSFMLRQEWLYGNVTTYYNPRFIKPRKGWKYKYSVHEGLYCNTDDQITIQLPDSIVLFQDRTMDNDGKTKNRFPRDKELLLRDFKKDPTDPRVLFYLAQTCGCLDQYEEAFYYYKLRVENPISGFEEEKFHAYIRLGDLAKSKLGHPWGDCVKWYLQAFEHSKRVEPLLRITQYYVDQKQWLIAYTFCRTAGLLPFPEKTLLFIDKLAYEHTRWHLLGYICTFLPEHHREGKAAMQCALDSGVNTEGNKNILGFYLKAEREVAEKKKAEAERARAHAEAEAQKSFLPEVAKRAPPKKSKKKKK